jgi:hypothetical protein
MCDYSLAALRTRLAVEGEELVVYRFSTGTLGMTAPDELEKHRQELRGWRSWLNPRETQCAVCIPPYSQLLFRDIPERLQRQLGIGPVEEVTFIQMSDMPGRHRDGIRFRNNQELLLQHVAEGQRVKVLSLSLAQEEEVTGTEQVGAFIR